MLTIHQLPPAFDLPVSVSQYCTKLELYCRLTNRDVRTADGDLRKSPNKRVPYVTWPDGRVSADSAEIIAELEASGNGLDVGLSPRDIELSEESTGLAQGPVYYSTLYARFVEDAGWAHQKAVVKDILPKLLAPLIASVIRSSQRKQCAANGFSARSDFAKSVEAIRRIEEVLGDKPYLLGERPHVVDCTVWANLLHSAYTRSENPTRSAVQNSKTLIDYINRLAGDANLTLPPIPNGS